MEGKVTKKSGKVEKIARQPMGNNVQKMREALKRIDMRLVSINCVDAVQKRSIDNCRILIKQALTIPLLNCDVGTADEQTDRYDEYCNRHFKESDKGGTCEDCPLASRANWSCQLAWAQMPYNESEAKE